MTGQEKDGKQTTADVLVDRLLDWGVSVLFGLPGDGIIAGSREL